MVPLGPGGEPDGELTPAQAGDREVHGIRRRLSIRGQPVRPLEGTVSRDDLAVVELADRRTRRQVEPGGSGELDGLGLGRGDGPVEQECEQKADDPACLAPWGMPRI